MTWGLSPVGPTLVLIQDAIIVAIVVMGIWRRWPVFWQLRHDPDRRGDIRLAGTVSGMVLAFFVVRDTLIWLTAATGREVLIGMPPDGWPLDAVIRGFGIVVLAYAIVVRRRRK